MPERPKPKTLKAAARDLESRFPTRLAEREFEKEAPWAAALVEPIRPSSYPLLKAGDLLTSRHHGTFIRPCPATPRYNCCGLNIFHIGQGCDLGCSYCVLSAYLGTEAVILFGNAASDGLAELERRLGDMEAGISRLPEGSPEPSRRFCTGEFTDSLLLDDRTRLSERLVGLFKSRPGFFLELKTKTAKVDHLLDLDHGGRTVISFSVNAPVICQAEEPLAASLGGRLRAAAKASAKGYPVGFHFDPLIFHDGWREGYGQTAKMIGQSVAPSSIAWISMGCFRYPPALKPIMLKRRPSALFDAEFIRGGDGKMRYPRPLRLIMYKAVLELLKPVLGPETIVYLCMESPDVWRGVTGEDPGTPGLTKMFS
jgi:spore photoproduct lyase